METKITHDVEEHFHRGHAERHEYDPGLIVHYKIKINDDYYEVESSEITGTGLLELTNLNVQTHSVFAIHKDGKKEIEPHEIADLGGYGIEKFVTELKKGDDKHDVEIIVNGMLKKWEKEQIAFKEVIILAYGKYDDRPTMVYTVAYEDGPHQNPEGSMRKDTSVFVKNKMIFHATATDKS